MTTTNSLPHWQRPMFIGLLGLTLMLGGWQALRYAPQDNEYARRQQLLSEMRAAARNDPMHRILAERLEQIAQQSSRPSSYQTLGRVAIFSGLFLFMIAGIQMYRRPASPEEDDLEDKL